MQDVVQQTHQLFSNTLQTVATAESCTGGLLAYWLTELPGSSRYYLGGISSYSNSAKEKFLKVDRQDIDRHGAVSEEVAKGMACGALQSFQSDYAVSITAIAGPDGGTAQKPVGTVWVAVATKGGVKSRLLALSGTRSEIRLQAAAAALTFLCEEVK